MALSLAPSIAKYGFCLYIGMLTGVFEVLAVYWVVRITTLSRYNFKQVSAFALAFGSIEAIAVGLMGSFALPSGNGLLFAATLERIAMISIHFICCVLLFSSVRFSDLRWMWIAFAIKTLVDAMAGWFQVFGKYEYASRVQYVWNIEYINVVIAAGCAIVYLHKKKVWQVRYDCHELQEASITR
jgi:uncharacterized membrane protein YhfC